LRQSMSSQEVNSLGTYSVASDALSVSVMMSLHYAGRLNVFVQLYVQN